MKPEQYKQFQQKLFAEIIDMTAKKAADYAGSEDVFGNYRLSEKTGICTAQMGILIRMMDKINRIIHIEKKGGNAVPNESKEDAARDIIGYASSLLGLWAEPEGDKDLSIKMRCCHGTDWDKSCDLCGFSMDAKEILG
jgi:hypothetical protein